MIFEDKYIKKFWKKVDVKNENDCWSWTGNLAKNNYGSFYMGKSFGAMTSNRITYMIFFGNIAKDYQIKHLCENKLCCNPHHLISLSQGKKINTRDKFIKKFWSYVNIRGENECWEWTKSRSIDGYGTISYTDGNLKKVLKSHRVAYELTYGPIPEGMEIRHYVCDNPPCCNPNHLLVGTHLDNLKDMELKGRRGASRGENNPKSVFTEPQVLEIRELYQKKGYTYKKIADIYGVWPNSIKNIITGKSWKHVGSIKESKYEDCRYSISKVKKDDVLKIRYLFDNNINTIEELCEIYDMSKSGMRSIVKRETWKDVL